jgi:hypothetical protein
MPVIWDVSFGEKIKDDFSIIGIMRGGIFFQGMEALGGFLKYFARNKNFAKYFLDQS